MKKIGIYAGTFDPIHNGHLAFAHAALNAGLEKVMFLPEPRPRRKQGVRALEHRISMVQLAIKKEPRLGTIVLEQARFTPHETLPVLQARFKGYQVVLLFGDDVIKHIADWPNVEAIVSASELLIACRQQDTKQLKTSLKVLEETRNLKFKYTIVESQFGSATSSTIRLRLKQDKPVADVPKPVLSYIAKHKLYSSVD